MRAISSPAAVTAKVLIIGGGPGGMEAARLLAEQGHQVPVEREHDLGARPASRPWPMSPMSALCTIWLAL